MKYFRKTARYNGKKYEATGKTELEALQKLAEKLAAAKRGEDVVGGSMTVDAWYSEWKALYKEPKGLTAKSLGMYDEKYRNYIKPRIGHLKLRDVRDVHLQRILNDQAGRSSSHVKKLRMVMQEMFKRARQSRLIPFDPAELLELPVTTAGRRRAGRAAHPDAEPVGQSPCVQVADGRGARQHQRVKADDPPHIGRIAPQLQRHVGRGGERWGRKVRS